MAKIRIKFGDNEIEIDSRDFYIDNKTVSEVIEILTQKIYENSTTKSENTVGNHPIEEISYLEDAETFEPEFSHPIIIKGDQIKSRIRFLQSRSFFNTPRTVSETVSQLSEYGWLTNPLQVAQELNRMVNNQEIIKNSQENRNFYITKEALLSN